MNSKPTEDRVEIMPSPRPSVIQRRSARDIADAAQVAAAITPIPGQSTTGFDAHAGEVMASPQVFAIYWGRDYGSPATGVNATAATFDSFFSTIMNSTYLDNLRQYLVGRGTYLGSTWVDHDPASPKTLSFDQMRDVLISWLDLGISPALPTWDEKNLLFVIFTSVEITLSDNSGQTGGFCAYHWWGHYHNSPFQKGNLFFAVIGQGAGTSAVAHELSEAFTDRSLNGWYSNDAPYSEIGDVCSSCGSPSLTLGDFPVASYWLAIPGRCLQQMDLTPGPDVAVPDVVGMSDSAAVTELQSVGLVPVERLVVDHTCNNIGDVVSQSPAGGSNSHRGFTVTIWVGDNPPHPCP
jgi:hypothetical protein